MPGGRSAAAASSSEPSIATCAVSRSTPLGGADPCATCRRGPRRRSRTTRPRPTTRPSGPVSRHWNEVERRRVRLRHRVGRVDRAGRGRPGRPRRAAPARRRSGPRRAGCRPVVVRVGGGAHRAGHDHRRLAVEHEVPQERGLLDHVGALHDDHAVDRGIGLAAANLARDLEQLREREVARGRAPEVDRHEIRDPLDARRAGEDRRAVERRDLPAGRGVDDHADRPAGEDAPRPAHERARASAAPAARRPGRFGPGRVELRARARSSEMTSGSSSARIGPALDDREQARHEHEGRDRQDHRGRADEVGDRADDDDRQDARDRDEHVQDAEHAAPDVGRDVLLELDLRRDRDDAVAHAGEEADRDDDRRGATSARTGRRPAAGRRRRSGCGSPARRPSRITSRIPSSTSPSSIARRRAISTCRSCSAAGRRTRSRCRAAGRRR